MTENDLQIIKSVESLQGISGIGTTRHQEKKQNKQSHKQQANQMDNQNLSADEENEAQYPKDSSNIIDYQA